MNKENLTLRLTTVSRNIARHFRSSEFKTHRECTLEGGGEGEAGERELESPVSIK